ncbi:MAG: hypothetical protein ACREGJ_03670 [Candidatus Saccharimonadales bacterium]
MNHIKSAFVVVLGFLLLVPVAVNAENATSPERAALIHDNCTNLKRLLQQQQRRDLVSRNNRGRGYESLVTQLEAFSDRLHYNKINADRHDRLLVDLKATVDRFRNAYLHYDATLTALIQADCQAKPADFGVLLDQTRSARQAIGNEVTKAEELTIEYRKAVTDLRTQIEQLNATAARVKE